MRNQKFFCLGVSLSVLLAAEGIASAVTVSGVVLPLSTTPTYANVVTMGVSSPGDTLRIVTDPTYPLAGSAVASQDLTFSGALQTDLGVSFDPGHAATVNTVSFIYNDGVTGMNRMTTSNMNMTGLTVQYWDTVDFDTPQWVNLLTNVSVTTSNLEASVWTPAQSPTPGIITVDSSGHFAIQNATDSTQSLQVMMNSGTANLDDDQALNEDYDFSTPGNARQGVLLGDNGTITVSAPTLVSGSTYRYLLDLVLPIQFSESPNSLVTMTANGTVHATGSFEETFDVPEPGSLAMLLGLAASLAGYGCWKRRGAR